MVQIVSTLIKKKETLFTDHKKIRGNQIGCIFYNLYVRTYELIWIIPFLFWMVYLLKFWWKIKGTERRF